MGDLISVIVPVYNVETYLDRCLNSIVNQTYKNIEILLINDGSTDSSSDICNEWQNKDFRIRTIHQEHAGIAETRNVGINNSNGKYISFIDSDDFIDERFLELLYNTLIETNSDISMCKFIKTKNDKSLNLKSTNIITEYTSQDAIINNLKEFDISNYVWDKLFSRKLFERY